METASLSELRVGEFLDRLASDRPTPGGGSVAALVGASGAALGRMAAALTLGKPRFADVAERVAHCARRLERIDRLFAASWTRTPRPTASFMRRFDCRRTLRSAPSGLRKPPVLPRACRSRPSRSPGNR
ncbi:MAG: cyclodeaminase/cyclohydrolase family protein [Planctomycetes bacterium]|nr:cyclodeaminase/cyclohydrolase family protein [Planctomycetota bacterium]